MGQIELTTTQINNDLKAINSAGVEYTAGGDFISNGYMFTADGGVAVQMVNKTGANSVKGSLVDLHSNDDSFQLSSEEFDTIGAVYESGVADASRCWVTITGKAKVLIEDATASTAGYWVYSSTTAGRANATLALPPGGTIGALENHMKEIGHCLESQSAGTNVLALVNLHFN